MLKLNNFYTTNRTVLKDYIEFSQYCLSNRLYLNCGVKEEHPKVASRLAEYTSIVHAQNFRVGVWGLCLK